MNILRIVKKKFLYLAAVVVLGVLIAVILIFKTKKETGVIELKASVSYSFKERNFMIKNIDTVDFVHAKVVIDEYYSLDDFNLLIGETYTIWQVEFAQYNGTRYPIKYKPRLLSIWCVLNDKKSGFYSKRIH